MSNRLKTGVFTFSLVLVSLFSYSYDAHALSVFLTVQGGTGTSSPSGILAGDNGATAALHTVVVGSGLSYNAGTFTLSANGGGTVTQINTTWPIQGGPITTSGTITYGGLATTSQPTAGQMLYSNGTNGLVPVSTTTASCSGSASCSQFTIIGSSPVTISASGGGGSGGGLATSAPISAGNLLEYNSSGAGTAFGVGTSTLGGGTTGLTFSNNPVLIAASPSVLSGTLAIANGGTNSTSYPNNSLMFYNGTSITSTSSDPLYISTFAATSTTGTSTISNALGIGTGLPATWSNLLYFEATNAAPASVSSGGALHIDSPTTNTGPALEVHVSAGASAAGRGIVFNQTNAFDVQDFILASSSAGNTSTLDVQGMPTGKGIIKIDFAGGPTGFSNGSGLSIDTSSNDAQGVFIKTGTGIPLNIVNSGSSKLFQIDSQGNSTTTNLVEIDSLTAGRVVASNGNRTLYSVATTTVNAGTGLTGALTTLAGTDSIALSVPVSIANGGTGSTTDVQGQVLYGGNGSYQSVATSTLTAGNGLTGSFTQIGTGGSIALSAPVSIANGGTGSTTDVQGQLFYGGNGSYQSIATTSVTCTGSASCTGFTVIGSSPITINATGGGGGGSDPFTHAQIGMSATTSALGIGTTTPWAQLSVSSSTAGSALTPLFAIASNTNATILSVMGSGKVGIGTTSPSSVLTIQGNGDVVPFYIEDSVANSGWGINLRNRSTDPGAAANYTLCNANADRTCGKYFTSLFEDSSTFNNGGAYNQFNDGGVYVSDANLDLAAATSSPTVVAAGATAGAVQLQAGGNAFANIRMFIEPSGNIGIGTSSPNGLFAVTSTSTTATENLQTWDDRGTPVATLSTSSAPLLGIGSSSPFYTFSVGVSGSSFAIDSNGNVVTTGAKPTLGTCGTATISATSTDMRGVIRITGGTPTQCNITFAHVKSDSPICVPGDNSLTLGADVIAASTTGVSFGLGAAFSGEVRYICSQ